MSRRVHTTLRRHRHDLELLVLVGLLLMAIAGHLAEELGSARQEGASWRHIDTEAVRRLIDAGELSDREALWYHPTRRPPRRREAAP